MILVPYERRTHRQGRLIDEIAKGQLRLEASGLAPLRFAFAVGEESVGLYSAVSVGPWEVQLSRAWNSGKDTWDVFRQMWIPGKPVKQLGKVRPNAPMFLVELAEGSDRPIDRVAFSCAGVSFQDSVMEEDPSLFVEQVTVLGVVILG